MSSLELPGERTRLRVSFVWRDEVMNDAVLAEPKPVVLGSGPKATFTIPKLGLPDKYAILRPGSRGYVLTLGAGMSGKMKLAGEELAVEEWLERGRGDLADGVQGSFRATNVTPGDWGVIHLDGRGDYSFFFQFVPDDPPIPRPSFKDRDLVLPAVAFAVILHSVLLIVAFALKPERPAWAFPGRRELAMEYLVKRPPPPVQEKEEPKAGVEDSEEKEPASTAGKEGKAGGEGEKPRKKAPDAAKGKPDEVIPERIQRGLLTERNRRSMDRVLHMGGISEDMGKRLARLGPVAQEGSLGGSGPGKGTGFGPGEGTGTVTRSGKGGSGGGGKAHADFQTQKAIKTGGKKAPHGMGGKGVKEVKVHVSNGRATGDLGGLTPAQILKVIRSRQNLIRTCYSRQLQRNKGLGGKIVIHWKINAAGRVLGARVRQTTMHNSMVEDCIVRVINRLQFPKPKNGVVAKVRFPFIFAQR